MLRNNLPDTVQIDSEVIVDQDISESRYGPPIDLGMKLFDLLADALRRCGKGLEISQYGVLDQFRLAKRPLAALAITIDARNAFENVIDV